MIASLPALILLLAAATGGPPIDISLLSLLKPQALEITSDGPQQVTVSVNGKPLSFELAAGERLQIIRSGGGMTWHVVGAGEPRLASLVRVSGDADCTITLLRPHPRVRHVHGELTINPGTVFLHVILRAPLEQVVAEVTAAEMDGASSPAQALMAQAVCVRSWILALGSRHRHDGFTICDTTHCLLYRGRDGAFGRTGTAGLAAGEAAAAATAGWILANEGRVVPGWFHAACGGWTAAPATVWGSIPDGDAVTGVACEYCAAREETWRCDLSRAVIARALSLPETGDIALSIEKEPAGRYVRAVMIRAGARLLRMDADRFRILIGRALGWNRLRSNIWEPGTDNGGFSFVGRGAGHGVGLCQAGAQAAARAGQDWRGILLHYFPRCALTTISP